MMRMGQMLKFSTKKDDGSRLRLLVKIAGGVIFMTFNIGMLYYWWSQEEEGRKRAD
jgi:hypothetical protein